MSLTIGNLNVGQDHPCAVVAEIGNAHNGSFARALKLLDAAKAAGASAAKLQCYTVDELIVLRGDGPAPAPWHDRTMRDLYTQAVTPHEWFPALYAHAAMLELPLFSSVFGKESLAVLESVGNPCYKIARLDNKHADLIDWAREAGKSLLVSVGPDDRWIVPTHVRDEERVYCPPGYPAIVTGLPQLAHWNHCASYGTYWDIRYIGLSSHCLDPRLPIAAVARGAKLLEYHFQLFEEPSELEAEISLNEFEFAKMVQDVRATEAMLG